MTRPENESTPAGEQQGEGGPTVQPVGAERADGSAPVPADHAGHPAPSHDVDAATAGPAPTSQPDGGGDVPATGNAQSPASGPTPSDTPPVADREAGAAADVPSAEPVAAPTAAVDQAGSTPAEPQTVSLDKGTAAPAEPETVSPDKGTPAPAESQTVVVDQSGTAPAAPQAVAAPAAALPPPYTGDDAVDEPADDEDDEGTRSLSTAARIVLAVVALSLVAALLTLGWLWRGNLIDERAREQALTAARQSAINLTSIDQEDFDGDVGRVLDGATGEFRTDFSGRVAQLQQLVEENEVSAEGRVLEAGLVRADRRSATALVVVDSRVRNTAVPEGRVNSYRMRLELEKVGDEWRTSSLEFVG